MNQCIEVDSERIAEFCRKHHIRKLAFFGSVLREDFGPESDVDVLLEFEPAYPVGFIRLAGVGRELSELLGRAAHVSTPGGLSRYFKDDVLREAEVQYVAP